NERTGDGKGLGAWQDASARSALPLCDTAKLQRAPAFVLAPSPAGPAGSVDDRSPGALNQQCAFLRVSWRHRRSLERLDHVSVNQCLALRFLPQDGRPALDAITRAG